MSRVFKVDYIPDPDRGRPLWNAKIFVGVANQDPTIPSNQIQLTGDIGFPVGQSIPVPQPVRTNAGGITVYNNSPLDLNAPGQAYAIQIFDRNDNLIYNFPNVDGSVALDTSAQEEITGLTIWPETGGATTGQTIPAGSDGLRVGSTLYRINPDVINTGLITNITTDPNGTGELIVDNTDFYDLALYTVSTEASRGDGFVAGGLIFPTDLSSLNLGVQSTECPIDANIFNVDTGSGGELLYLWEPSGTLPAAPFTIEDISVNNTGGYDFTIDGSQYEFVNYENSDLRGGNKYPTTRRESNPRGWGFSLSQTNEERLFAIQSAINHANNGGVVTFDVGSDDIYEVAFTSGLGYAIDLRVDKKNIIVYGNGARIRIEPNAFDNYQIVNMDECDGIHIYDLNVIGDVGSHTGVTGEAGYGFRMRSSTNSSLVRCSASLCWGDGYLISGTETTTCDNIVIEDFVANNNRRNGGTVGSGFNIKIRGGIYKNTGRVEFTAPGAGIVLEPDANRIGDLDVNVSNVSFINNIGGSFQAIIDRQTVTPLFPGRTYVQCTINVDNITSVNDVGISSRGSVRVGGGALVGPPVNRVRGSINFTNTSVVAPFNDAVQISNWYQYFPPLTFNGLKVTDIYTGIPVGDPLPTAAIITTDFEAATLADPLFEFGDINIEGLEYIDTRGDTYSSTATLTNHRVTRPIWWRFNNPVTAVNPQTFENFRIRRFKTTIQPAGLSFLYNTDAGQQCDFGPDAFIYKLESSIIGQGQYGLGMIFEVQPTGTVALIMEMPETTDRVGTYHVVKSNREAPNRMIFRTAGDGAFGDEYIFLENGVRTGAQFEPANPAAIFEFYCPVEGLWVQV